MMSILLDEHSRVIVQGITGREGQARTRLMLDYGTNIVAGVTPGKGGTTVLGVPVFNTCGEAVEALGAGRLETSGVTNRGRDAGTPASTSTNRGRDAHPTSGAPVDISVLFVPAAGIKAAALEAIGAGIGLVVLVADRVPVWDAMEIAAAARAKGARFLGPNTLGIASPGKAVVGMIGGRAESAREWFKPPLPGMPGPVGAFGTSGPGGKPAGKPGTGVGIISRSGGMSSSTAYYLGQAGVRISGIVHIGGDAVLGLRIPEVALLFEDDPATDAIAVFGEIGGSQEEELAELITGGRVSKPVAAYIGGKAARAGTRFSHAGAIIEGNKGTHAGKVAALRAAGATVVDAFGELPEAVVGMLRARESRSLMTDAERKAVWTTAITKIEPNKVAVRGHDIAGLMGNVSFGAAVYLILTGRMPDEKVGRLMDAILVSSIDHGATPPSAIAARTVASTGASLSQAVAAGISSINRHHGGAIEDCARYLAALIEKARGSSIAAAAAEEVARIKSAGDRIPGFGHRIHTKDPRTARLFELAAAAGVGEMANSKSQMANSEGTSAGSNFPFISHITAARAIERAFADIGKPLPINVDGAIGAILGDLGLDPRVFNGIFMIARTPGLVAHVTEEQVRERPMRRIDPVNHAYDGPS